MFVFRNLGYLYRRYEKKFYFESYVCMLIGLFIIYKMDPFFLFGELELTIINIITYPFTRFFYYSCKEKLVGEIYYSGIMIILRYIFKFFVFMCLFYLSFLPGICCMIYILINENAKEYNRRKKIDKETIIDEHLEEFF